MGISDEGENADAMVLPEAISSKVAFTDEEPMSNPSKYLIVYQRLFMPLFSPIDPVSITSHYDEIDKEYEYIAVRKLFHPSWFEP